MRHILQLLKVVCPRRSRDRLRLAQAHMLKSLLLDLVERLIEDFVGRIVGGRVLEHLKLKLGTNRGGNYRDNGLGCLCLGPLCIRFNLLIRLLSRLPAWESLVQNVITSLGPFDHCVRISLGADRRFCPLRVHVIVRAISGVGV